MGEKYNTEDLVLAIAEELDVDDYYSHRHEPMFCIESLFVIQNKKIYIRFDDKFMDEKEFEKIKVETIGNIKGKLSWK